ncbi:hypothetical protein F4679DRAFT_526990 [Xylaria curta]|nr:hypothetical protein F4679DRAFT_526990 [Xylaria curta]
MALPFAPPAFMDASFTMSRPTKADIHTLAKIYFDSFATDPANTYWWSQDHDAMFEWLHERIRRKMSDRSVRHFQILDDQKEVVAFVRWDIPEGYEAQFGEWVGFDDVLDVSQAVGQDGADEPAAVTTAPVEEATLADAKTISIPRGADPELCGTFFAKPLLSTLPPFFFSFFSVECIKSSFDHHGDTPYLSNHATTHRSPLLAHRLIVTGLSLLCTSPKYFRRGAGKALVAPMLAIADAVGLRSYVEATAAGRPMYEKLGFQTVETKTLDAAVASGGRVKGMSTISIMIREPQPQ